MSDLLEMTVYNDVLRYYRRKRWPIRVENLGPDGRFNYKLSTSGLVENFSFFTVSALRAKADVQVHHNLKVQSAHDAHIYYTADISVTLSGGVITQKLKGGRRHSFVPNSALVTFFEVKNMNAFPELLLSFSGIALELMPGLFNGTKSLVLGGTHLVPSLVLSGRANAHCSHVADSLKARYGFNVISGLYANKGQIYSFKGLNEFDG